ncbi:PQQ-binding-like beta-propeller repeat protein [Mycolicibacterium sp. HK-90]|uniref:outer membrane protein assembly factor BamB family protein n=1 Tax=Mycolicibacterium sp. HK-90 TaxID=3056937 RepID=UPI002658C54B|nr:PQQ-binding-like beta-propeller repeat protein [Mycolicibacterium sp. HK-90]WKG06060.1 PQQ-binding-like beta-propeller repeat protein [Mycolicibacterium sp. HK-90]
MPEDSPAVRPWYRSLRRPLVSVAAGASVAAALAAIVSAIAMWTIRSSTDVMSSSQTAIGVVAIVVAVCVGILVLLGIGLRSRPSWGKLLVTLVGFIAAALAIWCIRRVVDLYGSRDAQVFVDSTGATVLAAAALLSAIAAAVLGVAAVAFARDVSGRTALSAFLVVALVTTVPTYRSVLDHRAEVWHPDLTATAATPAPVPDEIGPVRYRVPLEGRDRMPHIYRAGNGFVVDTRTGVTAYDGVTGEKRWHVGDFGTSGRLLVVRRDRGDAAGIVVLFLYHGIVAFDGSTGEVLWRREYSQGGEVTAATGSVDALGMAVFTSDAPEINNSQTRFHSLDPATGRERWNDLIDCSNPTLDPGTPGQFSYRCGGKPAVIDAHTGDITDMPGEYAPDAGSDVYVVSDPRPNEDPAQSDVTRVAGPDGRVIDEVPGTYPMSEARDGMLLLYGGGGTWLLRDYRNHRSIPLPLRIETRYGLDTIDTTWLNQRLVITTRYEFPQRLQIVDPARPSDIPAGVESPCPRDERLRELQAVAGAVIAQCGSIYVAGLIPPRG